MEDQTIIDHKGYDEEEEDDEDEDDDADDNDNFIALKHVSKCEPNPSHSLNTLTQFKKKVKDGKRAIVRMKKQQEGIQLDSLITDLILLESRLRSEQSQILSEIETRDTTIVYLRHEIEKLRRDNRRLIVRLKKITEYKDHRGVEIQDDSRVQGKRAEKETSGISCVIHTLENQSLMTNWNSEFNKNKSGQFTDKKGKNVDRIMHKPPIASKPTIFEKPSNRPVTAIAKSLGGQCNIVSTISRLLEEESDQGINGSSGSSEPSSPESTLKPSTPRVIRLARQYENGCLNNANDSRMSSNNQFVKVMVMDEYEVTSGYNSDAISDLDHDYENVLFRGNSNIDDDKVAEEEADDQNNNNNNFMPLTFGDEDNNLTSTDDQDEHTYSNIEFVSKEVVRREPEEEEKSNLGVETDTDYLSEQPSQYMRNVSRTRNNLDFVMTTSEESHLMDNFEEFTLDSLDLEDLNGDFSKEKENLSAMQIRLCGDGAETKTLTPFEIKENKGAVNILGGYEKFLEITGLSQKSIITPSRMFSNHRSVLKPRDIKHRDKLRAAFTSLSTLEEIPTTTSTTSVKESSPSSQSAQRYWREPYL